MHPWKGDNISNEQVENRTTTKVFSGNYIPVLVVFDHISDRAVRFKSAEGSTQTGFLPPNSRITGVRYSAAAFITNLPIEGPPVKKIKSNLRLYNLAS